MSVQVKRVVSLPTLPNFVKVGTESVNVSELSDRELRRIGKLWTEALVQHAAERRNAPQAGPLPPMEGFPVYHRGSRR